MRKHLFLALFLAALFVTGRAQQDTIADQHLKEVVVTAKLPLVEMSPGKITFRIDESVTRSSGSLYDILTSLPGVLINSGGTILLNGQGGVKILMDGKPSYLSGQELVNLLKSTPATQMDKIDLITQPSARYDAEGSNGIIDIRTRKIKLRGMNLMLNGSFNQGKRANGYGSASFNLREDRFNVYLGYSYSRGKQRVELETDCFFDGGKDRRHQLSYRNRTNDSHAFRAGCDFYPTARTSIGVSVNGTFGRQREGAGMFTEFGNSPVSGWTYTANRNEWRNLSAGALLNRRLAKKGGEFNLSFDYFRYAHPENQFIYSFKPDTLKGEMRGEVNLYTAQTDFTYPLNERLKWEAGAKASFVRIDNLAGYLRPVAAGWQPDATLGSRFVYDENIHAVYLQAGYEYRRLKLSAGLRLEYTHVKGNSGGNSLQGDSLFTGGYVHLFPTVAFSYALPADNALQLSYGRRITRPNYKDLNPFVYIFDDYTHEGGNTQLRPAFSDNVEAAYVYRNRLQAVLFFSYTGDAITKTYQERENRRIYVTPENMASYVQTGLRIHVADFSPTAWWSANLSVTGMYNRYRWTEKGAPVTNRRFTPLFGCTHLFTFGSGWSAELSGRYNGRMVYGQATIHPFSEVSLGIRKKILRGNGTVSLFVKDLFDTDYQKIDLSVSGQRGWLHERENKRMAGVSFSYRFRQGSEVKERKRKNAADETKRVNL